jgi:glycine C-acetyltransferase
LRTANAQYDGAFSMTSENRPQLSYLREQLAEMEAKALHSRQRVLDGEQLPIADFDGKEVINLSSNNYLGLATHKALRRAAITAIRRWGVGAGAVRPIAGTMRLHVELEEQIARFKGTAACVVFQSGFTANAGTVAALLSKDDLIISDELNHASIIDGCRLSKAAIEVYKHADVDDCERICRETSSRAGRKLLITDGVFSMDGDVAPLPALCDLAEKYNCIMMVDDAHASGVFGRNGRGTVDHFDCHGRVDVEVGTLSKAVGAMGGYVCGSAELVDFLRQRARPFLFSTGHPPSVVATCQAAFSLLDSAEGERLIGKLWSNTKFFQRRLRKLGFSTGKTQSPITPIHVGEAAKAQEFSRRLYEAGVFVFAVGYPTVPEGKARLRAIVTATHKRADLARAAEILAEVGRGLGIVAT